MYDVNRISGAEFKRLHIWSFQLTYMLIWVSLINDISLISARLPEVTRVVDVYLFGDTHELTSLDYNGGASWIRTHDRRRLAPLCELNMHS